MEKVNMEKVNMDQLSEVTGGGGSSKKTKKIKCPSCGRSITISSTATSAKCRCGTVITVVKKPF